MEEKKKSFMMSDNPYQVLFMDIKKLGSMTQEQIDAYVLEQKNKLLELNSKDRDTKEGQELEKAVKDAYEKIKDADSRALYSKWHEEQDQKEAQKKHIEEMTKEKNELREDLNKPYDIIGISREIVYKMSEKEADEYIARNIKTKISIVEKNPKLFDTRGQEFIELYKLVR